MVCSDWLGLLSLCYPPLPLHQPPHVLQPETDVPGPIRVTWIGRNKEWGEGWFTKARDTRQKSIYLPSYITGYSKKAKALGFKVQSARMMGSDKIQTVLLSTLFYK